jgi:hypothetical protein
VLSIKVLKWGNMKKLGGAKSHTNSVSKILEYLMFSKSIGNSKINCKSIYREFLLVPLIFLYALPLFK